MLELNGSLVFTDLDGTLLDHNTYSFEPALPTILALADHNIPVIPVTSKTRAEVLVLREQLGLSTPFIVENGAAIFIPKAYFSYSDESLLDRGEYWCKPFGPSRKELNDLLSELKEGFEHCVTSFSDLGAEGVSAVTNLGIEESRRANDREFSEPLLWTGEQNHKTEFISAVESRGYRVLEGGRFLHITNGYDKGKALVWLKQQYMRATPNQALTTIALGDSNNDIDMLEAADQAVVINNPNSKPLVLDKTIKEIRSIMPGPEGWTEVLTSFLKLDVTV